MNGDEGIVYMYKYGVDGFELVVTLLQSLTADAVETLDLSNFGNSLSIFDAPEVGAPETQFAATLAVGTPSEQGAVFMYSASDSLNAQWVMQYVILTPDDSVTRFGQTVSLYSNTLVGHV
jgi:hypothetical protein